jgi:NOL1/NOP2/fmu family ribosome biogenesis protein
LKRKIKFTKESKSKIKIKRMGIKLEEIKNQGYESKDEIKNKIKFDKMTNYQAEKSKH